MIMARCLAALTATLLMVSCASADTVAEWNFNAETSPGNASTGTGTSSGSSFPFTSALPVSTGSPADTNLVTINGGPNNGTAARSGPQPGEESGTRNFGINTSLLGYETPTISWDMLLGYRASRYYQITATTDGTNYSPVPTGSGSSASVLGSGTQTSQSATVTPDGLITVITNDNMIPDAATGEAFIQGLSYTFPSGTAYDNNPDFGIRIAAVHDPAGTDFVSSFAGTTFDEDADKGYIRSTSLGGNAVRYDLVSVTANAVPEPAGFALMGGFALALLSMRRRNG